MKELEAAEQYSEEMGISSPDEEAVTEALNRIYKEEDSSLDPVLAAIQAGSLPPAELWLFSSRLAPGLP